MKYDLIWLEKEALPWLPTFMEIARLPGLPYVVDYDDAWFHRYEHHWASPLLGHKIDAVMRVAHMVVAGNDYLARRARQAGARRSRLCPTAIDLARYRDLPAASANGALTVGWIGIPLNAHYLTAIAPALRAVGHHPSQAACRRCACAGRICGHPRRKHPVDRGHRDRAASRNLTSGSCRSPTRLSSAVSAPTSAAGDGGGQTRDCLAGRCQPASGAAWRQRLPRRNDRGMGRRRCATSADPELRR